MANLPSKNDLILQHSEIEKLAAELLIANKELAFQNQEKEKRAAELLVANKELAFQNQEKEKRANELLIANAEIINRTEELELVNLELEAFSYSVSHDLRAPLRIVNGYASILHEEYNDLFDNEGKRLLSIIQESARKMGFLIDDLLSFSRLGRKEIFKLNVDMNILVSAATTDLMDMTPHKAQLIIGNLTSVPADKALMIQVWMNLISNAVKYSFHKENPIVHISSEETSDAVIYKIEDNGVGFDMRYVHKLFGVFQRLHSAEEFEGVGVGLALVHRIIKKHGGKIWATAVVGQGAVFYFSLPKY